MTTGLQSPLDKIGGHIIDLVFGRPTSGRTRFAVPNQYPLKSLTQMLECRPTPCGGCRLGFLSILSGREQIVIRHRFWDRRKGGRHH